MEHHQFLEPTVADYVRAFKAIAPGITRKQYSVLVAHHQAPGRVISATKLADEVGFNSYVTANRVYGTLGGKVAKSLGIRLKGVNIGILVDFVDPHYAANEHFLWVLRANVAIALEQLDWVPRVSRYLFPDLAMSHTEPARRPLYGA